MPSLRQEILRLRPFSRVSNLETSYRYGERFNLFVSVLKHPLQVETDDESFATWHAGIDSIVFRARDAWYTGQAVTNSILVRQTMLEEAQDYCEENIRVGAVLALFNARVVWSGYDMPVMHVKLDPQSSIVYIKSPEEA